MQSWSDIPNELLNLITVHCGRECKKIKWMFVNKHWFTFYLSQIYSTIKISLGNETILNRIFNSPFLIGKYVKRINLSDIQKPQNLNLNEARIYTDKLALIMQRTPNVLEVNLFRSNKSLIYQDWLYLSIVLVTLNCWKLQFLPTLGEDNILSAAYYYACAYYSRHTLKKLELTFSMLSTQNFCVLKEFTALESFEVHDTLINELGDLGSLLPYMPKLQELTIRFDSNRAHLIKKELKVYPNIKKLWLYNFTPQKDYELLTIVKKFSALQNLYIFGEKDKKWLSKVNDPLTIENFFSSINSIPKYEIMLPGNKQEIEFSESWLQSINRSEQDVYLLHDFSGHHDQNHLRYGTNTVPTFYGGSALSIPYLKYTIMGTLPFQETSDALQVLHSRRFSCFRVISIMFGLYQYFNIIDEMRTNLKQIDFFKSTLDAYTPLNNTSLALQHIKRIIFRNCNIDLTPLKSFIKKIKSLDYVEFDNCMFGRCMVEKPIDMSNTNIKLMKICNFQSISSGKSQTKTVQNIITISIYLATQNVTRYFSVVENNLFENTKLTYNMFWKKFNVNEAVVLNIRAKSMQELSFTLTDTSKMFKLSLA